jgi:hypothetical protein
MKRSRSNALTPRGAWTRELYEENEHGGPCVLIPTQINDRFNISVPPVSSNPKRVGAESNILGAGTEILSRTRLFKEVRWEPRFQISHPMGTKQPKSNMYSDQTKSHEFLTHTYGVHTVLCTPYPAAYPLFERTFAALHCAHPAH